MRLSKSPSRAKNTRLLRTYVEVPMAHKGKKGMAPPSKGTAKAAGKARSEKIGKPLARASETSGLNKASAADQQKDRREALHRILISKRQEILDEIKEGLGQSLTEDERRRFEAAMDTGDQAVMDVERELGISLLEMRNRKRQLIDEALVRLAHGMYGICAECGIDISEKRLGAVPFAKLCVECQSKQELLEKIVKGEERE